MTNKVDRSMGLLHLVQYQIISISLMWIYHSHQFNWVKVLKVMIFFARLKSSRRAFQRNVAAIDCCPTARKLPKFFHVKNFSFFLTLPQFEACDMSQSPSINDPPGLDSLPDRLRIWWRRLVQTFQQWYRDSLLCLVYTDKWQASVLAVSALP